MDCDGDSAAAVFKIFPFFFCLLQICVYRMRNRLAFPPLTPAGGPIHFRVLEGEDVFYSFRSLWVLLLVSCAVVEEEEFYSFSYHHFAPCVLPCLDSFQPSVLYFSHLSAGREEKKEKRRWSY